jgi:hypothetical protein
MPLELTSAHELAKFINKYPDPVVDSIVLNMYGPLQNPIMSDVKAAELKDFASQAKALAKVLKSGNCPQNTEVHLHLTNEYGHFDDLGRTRTQILPIFKALGSGNCPEHLTISLEGEASRQQTFGFHNPAMNTHPYPEEMDALVNALSSGKAPANLHIHLGEVCAYTSVGIERLIPVLKSGKCPPGLQISYDRIIVISLSEDKKSQIEIYNKFDTLLKTYEATDIKNNMLKISKEILAVLESEMKSMLKRKHIKDPEKLLLNDYGRYKILHDLQKKIENITTKEIAAINSKKMDAWKTPFQDNLTKAIKKSMNNPALDKYNASQKFFRRLLNVVTVLFAPVKRLATGTFFYSTTGKSKEAVEKAFKMSKSISRKRP